MIANYEIVEFIDYARVDLTNIQFSSKSVCTDALSKQGNNKEERNLGNVRLFIISKLKRFEL